MRQDENLGSKGQLIIDSGKGHEPLNLADRKQDSISRNGYLGVRSTMFGACWRCVVMFCTVFADNAKSERIVYRLRL